MTLIELRDYVREKRRVSLHDLSCAFHVEPGVVEGMAAIWIQKGKIACHEDASNCGSCCSCDKGLRVYYEWIG